MMEFRKTYTIFVFSTKFHLPQKFITIITDEQHRAKQISNCPKKDILDKTASTNGGQLTQIFCVTSA